jgi:hypothetical protein
MRPKMKTLNLNRNLEAQKTKRTKRKNPLKTMEKLRIRSPLGGFRKRRLQGREKTEASIKDLLLPRAPTTLDLLLCLGQSVL